MQGYGKSVADFRTQSGLTPNARIINKIIKLTIFSAFNK